MLAVAERLVTLIEEKCLKTAMEVSVLEKKENVGISLTMKLSTFTFEILNRQKILPMYFDQFLPILIQP